MPFTPIQQIMLVVYEKARLNQSYRRPQRQIPKRIAMSDNVFGFSPNYYDNQQSAGLTVYISPGEINGRLIPGQVVQVPANATTNISINSAGVVSLSFGPHLYPIATVVTGQVVTSGSTGKNANTDNGILSISDQRPTGSFSF